MAVRLGDVIDDYCPRCRRLTNHAVAAMVGPEVAQSCCRTCNHGHEFRHGQLPPPKVKAKPASAFDQVLAGILGTQAPDPEPAAAKPAAQAKPAGRAVKARKPAAR